MENENKEKCTNTDLEQLKIDRIEENLHIDKEVVETKTIKVETSTEEVPFETNVQLDTINYNIERITKDEFVDAPIDKIETDDKIIISVVEEVLVIEKKLKLVEEIHISKNETTSDQEIKETLRKQRVDITNK